MAKVITFGELMLRLQPFMYERFVQASSFEATFGGGDSFGGDYNHVSVAEVEKLAGGDGSGRVQR